MLLLIVRVRKNWYIWREHSLGRIASGCIGTIAVIKAHIMIVGFWSGTLGPLYTSFIKKLSEIDLSIDERLDLLANEVL